MASSPQHEPTMEEILASIRKIISEDATDAQPAKQADADVLELTHEVPEEPLPPAPPEAGIVVPEIEHEASPVPEQAPLAEHPSEPAAEAPVAESDIVFVSNEESTVSSSAQDNNSDGIFSDKTRKAMDDAFAGSGRDGRAARAQRRPSPPHRFPAVEGDSVEAVFERAVRTSCRPGAAPVDGRPTRTTS